MTKSKSLIYRWDRGLSDRLDAAAISSTYEALATTRALTCDILFRHGEHRQLVELKCDPKDYTDPLLFALDNQATKLLSKYPHLKTGINTQEVAYQTWLACEEKCRDVNDSLDALTADPSRDLVFWRILSRARTIVSRVVGRVDLDYIFDHSRHGPGVTLDCKTDTSPYGKFGTEADVSPDALTYALAYRRHSSYKPETYHLKSHNALCFVPKTSRTDRPISIEPTLNIFFQLGAGALLRHRLKKCVGIDLDHQSTVHRRCTLLASVDDLLSTVDLESASDSVSLNLVRLLLPDDWFSLLCDLRSCETLLPDGTFHQNEKFSSMGNGYTFELETLVFYALVKSVALEVGDASFISVFGDDIICGLETAALLPDVLPKAGLTMNMAKSYLSGNFKESCGLDAFHGYNVRPFFLKERITNEGSLYHVANGLRDFSQRLSFIRRGELFPVPVRERVLPGPLGALLISAPPDAWVCDSQLLGAVSAWLSRLPKKAVRVVPYNFSSRQGYYDDVVPDSISFIVQKPRRKKLPSGERLLTHAIYLAGKSIWSCGQIDKKGSVKDVVKHTRVHSLSPRTGAWV